MGDDLVCPACGLGFPAGTRFCDQDGTPLGDASAAQASIAPSADPVSVSYDQDFGDYDEEGEEPRRRWVVPVVAAIALLAVSGGAGYAYWAGMLDRWIGKGPDPELVAAGKSAAAGDPSANNSPGLTGQYKGHLMDQDITLVVAGDKPLPLVSSAGEITYVNTVNGGTCTASLVPVKGGGVGGDTSNAVSFKQAPVPGKTPCPADIPVKMDISGEAADSAGVVGSVKVEWHSPEGDRTLMSGALVRQTAQ